MYRHFLEDDSEKFSSSGIEARPSQVNETREYFPKEYLEHSEIDVNRLSLEPDSASLIINKYHKSLRIHTQIDDNF